MGNTYDIIVAGAGHNGLIAGAYLARAGLSVCMVEQQKYVGGGVTTRELTVPGFRHDVCSIAHGLTRLPLIANDELGLKSKYGLEYIHAEETISILYPDHSYLVFYNDLDKTCEQIAQFSQHDAEAWRKMATWGMQIMAFMGEGQNKPPAPFGATMSMMDQSPEGREIQRLFLMSTLEVCEEYFESPQMITGLTRMVAESMVHPDRAVGMSIILMAAAGLAAGLGLPVGGSGRLSEALEQCIKDDGGTIMLESLIKEFKVEGGACTGVILENGEEILAKKMVINTLNVMQLSDMLPAGVLPEEYVKSSKRLKLSDFEAFKLELALKEPPAYKNDMPYNAKWFVECVDDWDLSGYLKVYDDLTFGGICPLKAPLLMCPTILDQGTRAPEGMHTLYYYLFAPYDLKEGPEHWDNIKEETEDRLLEYLVNRAPNMTSDNILGKFSMTPLDYARYNPTWIKGDFAHFTMNTRQMGGMRPFGGWANYKTPVEKLYMAGCSTHPGWAVRGAARTAMYVIFEELGMDFEEMYS